mmetsp:Transcript_104956/g.338452  ORF Transcript_104956/g.338452 Transcript_104956/m.338452 type:complete len:352 (+) Transcript_104956:335-1390(+)
MRTRCPGQSGAGSPAASKAGSFTKMTVSLSVPCSTGRPRQARAQQACRSSRPICSSAMPRASRGQMMSATSWLEQRSKRPSQATTSSSCGPPWKGVRVLSAKAMTFWLSGGKVLFAFRWKSPSARERFRVPSTRWQGPTFTTCPPAARMRLRSLGFSGLWSSDNAMALPLRISIARESPTLATSTSRLSKSTAATHAVDPQEAKGCSGPGSMRPKPQEPAFSRASSRGSASSKDSARPAPVLPPFLSLPRPQAWISSVSSRAVRAETSLPPWPSSTAKSAALGKTDGCSISATCASSMASRQPRMLQATQATASAMKVPASALTARSGVGPWRKPAAICRTSAEPTKATRP